MSEIFILKVGVFILKLRTKRSLMEVHPGGSSISSQEIDRPGESCGVGWSCEFQGRNTVRGRIFKSPNFLNQVDSLGAGSHTPLIPKGLRMVIDI